MSTFSTSSQYSFGILSQTNKTKAKMKGMQIGMEEVKLPLFADYIILYLTDPKNSTKKLLEIIN
jgi:hypothetical protein